MRKEDTEYLAKSLEVLAEMVRAKGAVAVEVQMGCPRGDVEAWLNRFSALQRHWNLEHPEQGLPEPFRMAFSDLIGEAGSDMGLW